MQSLRYKRIAEIKILLKTNISDSKKQVLNIELLKLKETCEIHKRIRLNIR